MSQTTTTPPTYVCQACPKPRVFKTRRNATKHATTTHGYRVHIQTRYK